MLCTIVYQPGHLRCSVGEHRSSSDGNRSVAMLKTGIVPQPGDVVAVPVSAGAHQHPEAQDVRDARVKQYLGF